MLNDLINSIDEAIDETTINVCESMANYIDKYNELFYHSDNMELLMEYTDTFNIYCESKNRERDKTPRNDIAKWMEKKGYWYTGDNPSKKKKCMRMYHFLQQYEFDPSDETILIVNKPGEKPRRVKFAVDCFNSIHGEELIGRGFPRSNDYEVKKGEGSYINYFNSPSREPDPIISIGSKELKEKQAYPQFSHGHESGHDNQIRYNDSIGRTTNGKRTATVYSSDQRGQEDIDFWKKMGRPKLSDYDDKIKEADADRYAAENAMTRTKNWGKNKETKHLTRKDMDMVFRKQNEKVNKFDEYRDLPHDETGMNSSTKYRRDYAKNYVKEYFDDFFGYSALYMD